MQFLNGFIIATKMGELSGDKAISIMDQVVRNQVVCNPVGFVARPASPKEKFDVV